MGGGGRGRGTKMDFAAFCKFCGRAAALRSRIGVALADIGQTRFRRSERGNGPGSPLPKESRREMVCSLFSDSLSISLQLPSVNCLLRFSQILYSMSWKGCGGISWAICVCSFGSRIVFLSSLIDSSPWPLLVEISILTCDTTVRCL